MPQQHHLIGRQTVLANVLMGKLASRGSLASMWPWSRADKLQALAVIERVGLLDKALARADTLSGGQQQRVGIARALVQGPNLLLADEPVASLDPATAQGVLTLLHDICKKDRLTAIVSLHQVNLARLFADRVVGMRQGQVVFEGLPAPGQGHPQVGVDERDIPRPAPRLGDRVKFSVWLPIGTKVKGVQPFVLSRLSNGENAWVGVWVPVADLKIGVCGELPG